MLITYVISFSAFSQNNWQGTYSPKGKCSISFPATPTAMPNPQTGSEMYSCLFDNSIFLFTVENSGEMVRDEGEPDIYDESLQKSMYNGLLERYNGHFISDANIYYKGKKAVDFYLSIEIPGTQIKYVKGRYIIENKIFYVAFYFYSSFDEINFNRFVSSLEFNK